MTEADWLSSDDPQRMMEHLRGGWHGYMQTPHGPNRPALLSDRKLRLFAVACCERWSRAKRVLPENQEPPEGMSVVAWATEWAATGGTLDKAKTSPVRAALLRDIFGNPFRPVKCSTGNTLGTDTVMMRSDGSLAGCDCRWLSPTVQQLAQAIYGEKCGKCEGKGQIYTGMDGMKWIPCASCHGTGHLTPCFDRMPILGDALEDAGCTNEEILEHCHGIVTNPKNTGAKWHGKGLMTCPHVRGCWLLDLILGKS